MSERKNEIADQILVLECTLRKMNLWESEKPSAEALASQQPFCIDTLNFTQWLQFIFIPRMVEILTHNHPLPLKSEIAPMAEEYFRGLPQHGHPAGFGKEIIDILTKIDKLLSH